MSQTISITLEELDVIFKSLDKACAIAQIIAECRAEREQMPTSLADGSWSLVMQMVVEELEKVVKLLKNCEPMEKKDALLTDDGVS